MSGKIFETDREVAERWAREYFSTIEPVPLDAQPEGTREMLLQHAAIYNKFVRGFVAAVCGTK